jgi:hypothetical protein
MVAGALHTSTTLTTNTVWRERVTAARQSLNAYDALTPVEMAARRRARLEGILAHHYSKTRNGTYRQVAQGHGLNWGEPPAGKVNVFGRLFRRENDAAPPRPPIPESMPLGDILAQLPVVDKSLLLAGNYREQPAVALEDIVYTPASSGTTSGVRGNTALAKQGLWSYTAETII